MGTNYYIRRKISQKDKNKIIKLLEENNSDGIVSVLRNNYDDIHICKMSCGWYTCFDHNNGEYYQPNRKSLEKFLEENRDCLYDEYGDKLTPEEFWENVRIHDSQKGPDGEELFDSKSYEEYERAKGNCTPYYDIESRKKFVKAKFGIECTNPSDFVVDGLRFAVYTDFC